MALILGYLAAGRDVAAIQREFPDLTATDVAACLDYARELAEFEAAPVLCPLDFTFEEASSPLRTNGNRLKDGENGV